MKEIKKYLIWFIIWLLSIWTITYAADSGSIGTLFVQLASWHSDNGTTLSLWRLDGKNIKDETISTLELMDNAITSDVLEWTGIGSTCEWLACVSYCINWSWSIVWMEWIEKGDNYNDCWNNEWGVKVKLITYKK